VVCGSRRRRITEEDTMQPRRLAKLEVPVVTAAIVTILVLAGRPADADRAGNLIASRDPFGQLRTFTTRGAFDLDNPFFKEIGTNGRACFTCHRPDQGWTVTPEDVQRRFIESRGLDPIFRNNDGSNCAGADIGSLSKRRRAFSLLLSRGLIRVGLDLPAGAEFTIEDVEDPYGCGAPTTSVSMYRRPLPSTNLAFLSAVMWDGRESSATTSIHQDLMQQADDATTGHAQAARHLTDREKQAIVAFETALFTAQAVSEDAGPLRADGAQGGPVALSADPFFTGINDPVGLNPTGAAFDPRAFTLFDAWMKASGPARDLRRARRAIARGQEIFNTKPIVLTGVAGLNNQTFPNGVTVPDPFTGTCTTCHDTPNAGAHSVKAPLNIGLTDAARRTADMPLYRLQRISTGETVQTTDPGRAMVTGKWADIGKFKGPILRGLAARAPYFHNGFAATFDEVIDFYESRFNIGFTAQERSDLIAFLEAL
jgi:cytochrome c peroxidase